MFFVGLSLDAAAGVAAGQGQDFIDGDLVVVAFDGVLQAACYNRKLDGLLCIEEAYYASRRI